MPRIDIFAREENGYSPLHIHLLGVRCSISKISRLLSSGVPINCVSDHYATPLHFAVKNPNCSDDVIKYLLENGADVNAKDDCGKTPLHYLLQCYNNSRVMDTFNILADYDLVIDELDETGSSVLHYAVKTGYSINIIKTLISCKADIYREDLLGNSPIHYAVINSSWDVLKILLNQKVKVHLNKPNRAYMQPLHLAAQNCSTRFVKLLLSKGSWMNVIDRDNRSPLLLSACFNEVEVTKVLLEAGAVVSCGDCPMRKLMSMHNIYENYIAFENMQLLVKYAVLEDAVSCTDCTSRALSGCDVSADLAQYWEKCRQEVRKLQSVFLGRDTTLGQFIFRLRWQMKLKSEDDARVVSDLLLGHLFLNTYPLYNEVMFGIIKRKYLIDGLENQVYAVSHQLESGVQESSVLLKFELTVLAKYLSKEELLNLTFAFYTSNVT